MTIVLYAYRYAAVKQRRSDVGDSCASSTRRLGLANGDEPRIIHSYATIGRAAPRRQLHAASPALTHRRSAAHAVAGSHAAGAGARQGTPQATAPSPTPRRRIPPP